jgi:hypothetical protein
VKTNYQTLVREQAGVPLQLEVEFDSERELKAQSLEIKVAQKQQWHQDHITQELFRSISSEIEALETRARELACNYPSNQNHQEVIQLLVRSAELRKLQKHYGRSSNN